MVLITLQKQERKVIWVACSQQSAKQMALHFEELLDLSDHSVCEYDHQSHLSMNLLHIDPQDVSMLVISIDYVCGLILID